MTRDRRRFTDRDVALVLKRATEIEERDLPGPGGGISVEDLREIAAEVGIPRVALERALATLDQRTGVGSWIAAAPLVQKSAYAVDGELSRDHIAHLMRIVDERAHGAGQITEALGSARWTRNDRLKDTLVSITPKDGETMLEVLEKSEPRLRRVFHAAPAIWTLIFAGPFVGALGLSTAGSLAVTGLAVTAAVGIGRGLWGMVSAASARRVRRLADALAAEAARPSPSSDETDHPAEPSADPRGLQRRGRGSRDRNLRKPDAISEG